MRLGTSKERVRLLKVGMSGKNIEALYIASNGLVVVKDNVLRTDLWQRLPEGRTCAQCQLFQGCARSIDRHGDEDICDYMPGKFKAKVIEVIECL